MRAPKDHVSTDPTPYAVHCFGSGFGCGKTYLTPKGYDHQMRYAGVRWKCPVCGGDADFDDDNFEDFMP